LSKSGSKLGGIAAATDELADGASLAVAGAGRTGKVTVTGAGVSDAGLRRLLLGTQSMTVYQAIKQEAQAAAKIAIAAAHGNATAAKAATKTTVDNGSGRVPAVLLTPIVVTSFNIGQTVLADGYTTRQSLCTAEVKDKCPA
jgi:D-xylose transport system substrate-binding protein